MEQEYKPLTIGVLGYNVSQTEYALKQIAEDNSEQIKNYNKNFLEFKDGTKFIPIYSNSKGLMIDQLVLFDDSRWNILNKQRYVINYVCMPMLACSCVPENYKIIYYDNDKEV